MPSSPYTPDRWRDRSIIAQASAKVAAQLLELEGARLVDDDGLRVDAVRFLELHELVFDSTMKLAGDPVDPTPAPSATTYIATTSASPSGSSSTRPGADFKVQFGKFKGMTISEIDMALSDDGKTGHSWLEWAADNLGEGAAKTKIRQYLGR